uniref:Uncharacterized protein n=1 Tax=viral metagenome TaxID=1070528 RepID=A0A6C0BTI5_9ZZZZ
MKTIKKNPMKKKKRTKKQKRSIKNRHEARKYIEIMNLAYKQITSSWHDIFDKDDYLLLSYIKQGIKQGWKILKDKNVVKEIKCNSLCMTMSILNSTLGTRKKLDQLDHTQKLYLFFISYLIDDSKLSKKQVSLKHALHKIDMRIMNQIKKLQNYELKKDNRNIKKCNKFIERQEELKKQLIESDGRNKEGIGSVFRIDVCNNVDCEYLHEYKMEKGKKWNESYSKFCLNITEIFKGIVWLNMYMIFNKTTKIKYLSPYMKKIETDINIRMSLKPIDIILIPDSNILNSNLFYEDNTLDRERKKASLSDNPKYWVYTNYNEKEGTIQKRGIDYLENKHYVAAIMSLPYDTDWRSPMEIKEKNMWKNFQNFLKGKDPVAKLKNIYKNTKNIDGKERYDLEENIENSITLHWIYIHRDKLNDFIEEYVN